MKIAIVGTKGMNFGKHAFGGFETVVTELAPRLVLRGHEVTVYCRRKLFKGETEFPKELNGVKLRYLGGIETKNFGTMTNSFLAVIDSLVRGDEVFFLFNLGLGLYLPLLRALGKQVVTNFDGVEWKRGKWGKAARLTFKLGAYLNVKLAHRLVSDAEEIRKIYLRKFGRDSDVIPYGAEIRDDLDSNNLKSYGLVAGGYYLLVTRFVPENNPLFIIREFLRSGSNRPLVVLGGNYYGSKYEEQVRNFQDPRIRFIGQVTDRKLLLELYRYSYVYIHGHSVGGTNPTMLEALANNACVLALDTVFNREMLDNGVYGTFFTLDKRSLTQKLDELDVNEKLVNAFKAKARLRVVSFYNWEMVTEKYIELLGKLGQLRSS